MEHFINYNHAFLSGIDLQHISSDKKKSNFNGTAFFKFNASPCVI